MKLGYFSHAFDLLNVEHLDLLGQAASRCDHLVVGVLSDADVEESTGQQPVAPFADRLALVQHVRVVQRAVPHDAAAPAPGYDVVFVLDDPTSTTAPVGGAEIGVLLEPRRTTSAILSRVLHPSGEEAVA